MWKTLITSFARLSYSEQFWWLSPEVKMDEEKFENFLGIIVLE
jgi:hypothetical protein